VYRTVLVPVFTVPFALRESRRLTPTAAGDIAFLAAVGDFVVVQTNTIRFLVVFVLSLSVWQTTAADKSWPSLPTQKLSFKNLGDKYAKSVKSESVEIRRGDSRIAQVTKVDRNADGTFEEFTFSAFVSKQRVFVLSRIGGPDELSQFLSLDDTIVMNDVRFPDSKLVALIIISKKHGWYEIFARHADGYYWPADDASVKVVDSYFRAQAEAFGLLLKKPQK